MEMRPNECVYMFIAYTCLLRIHVYCVYMFIIYCLLNANANMRPNECVFFQYTILGACTFPAKTDAYNLTIIYAWVVEEWCKSKINFVKFNPDNIISISNVEKTKTKEL